MKPIAVVVDDEPLVRMDTADIVTGAGYDVLEAETALEAITYLRQHADVRLVVTDIQMPEVDGLTLARHLAAHWRLVTVVVVSGAVTPTLGELPVDARFVAKPVSSEVLVEAIAGTGSLH
jgi:CheY-like chemotaxis protein